MIEEYGRSIYEEQSFMTISAPCNPQDNPEIGDKLYLTIIDDYYAYQSVPDDNIFGGWSFSGICCKEKDEHGYVKIVCLEKGYIT